MLSVRRLTKDFGGLRAVDDVSFDVSAGTIAAVIGPNGAGKTTMFNLVAGLEQADAGTVTLGDTDVTRLSAHARSRLGIARTFQLVHLVETMSVVDNVVLGLYAGRPHGVAGVRDSLRGLFDERDIKREARRALEVVGMGERADVPAGALSFGERRLAEVARAAVGRPSLIMLDEPAAGLNAREAEKLADVLRTLQEPDRAILLVEHNMPFVMALCDPITVLDQGHVIARGTPDEVQSDERVVHAYLGLSDD